jgi:MFS family permease
LISLFEIIRGLVEYKWTALSNTTVGVLMAALDGTIVLISLPAIFRGIQINPLTSFQYLLWILFGYSIITATLLVTFGRISDIFGRVKLYNLGFAIFTVGSTLCYLTPNTGDVGAIELISFRIIQGIGAAFLFANSAAIITDAFPENERGQALGINMVAVLAGSLIGLVGGGVLATYDWRYVFLVSVPVGIFGTFWSYNKQEPENRRLGKRRLRCWTHSFANRCNVWVDAIRKLIDGLGRSLGDHVFGARSRATCGIPAHRATRRRSNVQIGAIQNSGLCSWQLCWLARFNR